MFVPPESRRAFATLRISSSFTSLTSSTSRSLVHAQQAPQPLSSHTLTSQFPVHRGWRSVAQASACALSSPQPKSTPASAPPDPFDDSPLVCPEPLRATISRSPFAAILDAASSISPVFATLTKNIGVTSFKPKPPSARSSLSQSCGHSPFTSHRSPITVATNSFTIRTSEKHTDNPFRIRTSKTQDLKPFRMNIYEKTPRGGVAASSRQWPPSHQNGGVTTGSANHNSDQAVFQVERRSAWPLRLFAAP